MHIYYEDLQWPRQFTRLYWRWVVKVWGSSEIWDLSSPHPESWIYYVSNIITNVKIFCLKITIARLKLKEIGGDLLQRWNTCFKLTVNTKSYPTVLYYSHLYLRKLIKRLWFYKITAWLLSIRALKFLIQFFTNEIPLIILFG